MLCSVLGWGDNDDDFLEFGDMGLMDIAFELLGFSPVMKVLAPALPPVLFSQRIPCDMQSR